jgi:DNA-binding response OmpR family regulator
MNRAPSIRILLVEHDATAARRLVTGLQKQGFVVDHAATSEDGEDKATAHDYNLIVLDPARKTTARRPHAFKALLARITALLRHVRSAQETRGPPGTPLIHTIRGVGYRLGPETP